ASDFLFQETLNTDIEEEEAYDFFHPEIGNTLQVTYTEESWQKNSFYKASRVKFLPREAYDESTLEEVPNLDELLVVLPYDEIFAKFFGVDTDNDDEDRAPVAKKETPKTKTASKSKKDEDEDDDDEEEETIPLTSKGKKVAPKAKAEGFVDSWEQLEKMSESKLIKYIEDQELEVDPDDFDDDVQALRVAVAKELDIEVPKKKPAKAETKAPAKASKPVEDDADDDEEDDEEEAPKKPVKKTAPAPAKKSRKVVEEEDDDDEDEEEEEEAPKKAAPKAPVKPATGGCPHGHKFGKDNDKFKECAKCKVWDDCSEA
ncbi:MAG TPA: hypothetical protein VLS94_06405, partial [Fusibacter sp.]|nr:hypothetical protein [Fusibacter sp.]